MRNKTRDRTQNAKHETTLKNIIVIGELCLNVDKVFPTHSS